MQTHTLTHLILSTNYSHTLQSSQTIKIQNLTVNETHILNI